MFAPAYMGRKQYFSNAFTPCDMRPHTRALEGAAPHLFPPMYAGANMGHPSAVVNHLLGHHHWNARRDLVPVVEIVTIERVFVISSRGLAANTIRSARLPGRSVPLVASMPNNAALLLGSTYDGLHWSQPSVHHVFQFPVFGEARYASRHSTGVCSESNQNACVV